MPYLTALGNVMLPLAATRMSEPEQRERARAALHRVGLGDRMTRLPRDLSGGEQQRVAIERAIVNAPPVVLADEPTGCLDSRTGREIMDLFLTLKETGLTIFMVTHDQASAACADRIVTVEDGIVRGPASSGAADRDALPCVRGRNRGMARREGVEHDHA